ncbi:MAG: hypothetical protein B6I24_05275 [Bacteroidetes bacterium 4572_128]|nr:MAG: hypothetical protein B6I24_05275 [Bacteroidetes bacterium 4572_128]
MKLKTLRKWNRIIHRDLGYFFFVMTLIYSISGIAINHLRDWQPNYIIEDIEVKTDIDFNKVNEKKILLLLEKYSKKEDYKTYEVQDNKLIIFIKNGSLNLNIKNGEGIIKTIRSRPFFKQINYLHYNPNVLWTWFSDIFALALIILAISGLFIVRGKNGIKKRGVILVALGLLFPIIFLIF